MNSISIKIKKISYSIFGIVGIIMMMWILQPNASYAVEKTLYVGSSVTYTMGEFQGHTWIVRADNSNIVEVRKTTIAGGVPAIWVKGKEIGSTIIRMHDNKTGKDYKYTIKVVGKKIKAESVEVYSNRYIIMGQFSGHDWSVKSNDSNIVKVIKTRYAACPAIYCEGINAGTTKIIFKDYTNGIGYEMNFNVYRRNLTSGIYYTFNFKRPYYKKDGYYHVTYNNIRCLPEITSIKYNRTGAYIKNFKTTYGENKKAGWAWFSITGLGNNTGTVTMKFYIDKRSISGGYVYLDKPSYTYTGGQIKPKVTKVYLSNHTTPIYDYKIDSYGENKKAGTGWVKIKGTGSNTGTITKNFTIDKRNISNKYIYLSDKGKNSYVRADYYTASIIDNELQKPDVIVSLNDYGNNVLNSNSIKGRIYDYANPKAPDSGNKSNWSTKLQEPRYYEDDNR